MSQRKVWIDVAKGIGIIAVVYGHVLESHWVFLWHMPLFFVLAGWNYYVVDTWQYMKKLTKRLLLPYFVCLFIYLFMGYVFDIEALKLSLKDAVFGGAKLKGVYAVFWFVTVLYCVLLVLHFLSKIELHWWMVVASMIIGYFPVFYYVELPWSLQVVPMALAYGCLGCLLKRQIDSKIGIVRWYWIVIGLVILVFLSMIPRLSMDMKYNDFGVPVVSFVLSVFCVIVIFILSKFVEKVAPMSRFLAWLGKGSMVIMYVHMFINHLLSNTIDDCWNRFVLVLALSLAVFLIVQWVSILGRKLMME